MTSLKKRQEGLVLILTLVVVLVLTLSVVAGLKDSVNTQKMITSANAYQYAFELAESTSLAAYKEIDDLANTTIFDSGSRTGFHSKDQGPPPFNSALWNNDSVTVDIADLADEFDPSYIVEHMGTVTQGDISLDVQSYASSENLSQAEVFRVVVKAFDENGQSQQVIETFYARVF